MMMEEAFEKDTLLDLIAWNPYVSAFWFFLTCGSLAVAVIPQLSSVSQHGKFSSSSHKTLFDRLIVPKRFFSHFYIVGSIMSLSIMYSHVYVFQFTNTVALFLFFLHNIRRIYECWFVTEYGQSTMHIGGYLVGMVHYIIFPLTLELAILDRELFTTERKRQVNYSFYLILLLFILGNFLQYKSHEILYKTKRKFMKIYDEDSDQEEDNNTYQATTAGTPAPAPAPASNVSSNSPHETTPIRYPLPRGWGFEYCCCPHYFAEILIYFSLLCLEHHSFTMFLTFLWVLSNLSVVAYQQYWWYLEHYVEEIEERKLRILFPFVW